MSTSFDTTGRKFLRLTKLPLKPDQIAALMENCRRLTQIAEKRKLLPKADRKKFISERVPTSPSFTLRIADQARKLQEQIDAGKVSRIDD